ncbi:transport and Golgi organization protein 1 homolog [Epinephelus fuscoguttatus]|uniref:transport and Golgi organization protein 1 homolog n=1 Tax=Epinephelus fuscoguttatus TaxID=293821 RepID=UPI0020D07408|nr:transport and Golgi organization protein 1 homolog [Epinephelus fuscoguttatus]
MAVSQAYKILWGTSIFFMILPHLNLGLLSDYKICGDSACESFMSRVQAIRDHHGKDCRFLSFRRGDTFFVYHKLTGKREDLWAGSIDKQFGYFPKDAVQEEQVYATVEKVVETQKSDFFCMDEFGYPIDSSHLDSDDDGDDNDQKIQNQESETTQTTLYTDDTNAESLQTSEDPSTESPVSTQATEATLTEEDENKNTGDAAARTHEEAQETPAAPNEQGGSAPSSWLGSSVTGWLGLAKEEETENLADGEKEDEGKEMQAGASVASSVTGWLGLGGDGKPDDAIESREEDGESDDSITSTMTGWLGFGGEKKTDDSVEKEQGEERDNEEEPAEKFRSRRMSLDLEGSQLHEEEKKEMGTLGWLGNGLSSTLGFGITDQESGRETTAEIEAKEDEQPEPASWLDMGIGDMLGFGNDKSEVDESTGSGLKETEEDITLEQPTSSENMDTSQSQPALTEEITTNELEVEETQNDQDAPSEIRVSADSDNNDISTSDSSKDSVFPEDAASKIDQKDITPQTELERTPKAVGEMSSKLNNSEEEEEDNVSDIYRREEKNVLDLERSEEMEGKDHEMPKSIENESEDENRERGEQDIKTASDTDQGVFTQSDINLGPDVSFVDLTSNSMGGSVGEAEDKADDIVEEVAEIPNQINQNTEESTDASIKISVSSHEGERNDAQTDVLHREIPTTQTDDLAEQSQVSRGGESQPFLSSGATVERNEPVYSEDDSLPAHSVETSVEHSDSLAMIDSNTDTETQQGELGLEGELHPVEDSSQEFDSSNYTDRGTEMMNENASEEDRRMFSTSESTTQMENNADQDSYLHVQQGATQSAGDEHELKETVKDTEKDSEDKIQTVQTEKETIETESDEEEESKQGEKEGEREAIEEEEKLEELKEVGEINAQEKQQEVEEEKQSEVEELKEEEKQEEVEEKEQERVEELEKEVVHELREKEKQEEVDEIKEEDNQDELRELKEEETQGKGEELNEKEKNEEMEEVAVEKMQEEMEELKEEENHEALDEFEENKEQEEVEEIKEEDNQEGVEELKREETQGEGVELNENDKNDKMVEMMGEKKQEEMEELMKEENQEVVEEFEEKKEQEEVEQIKKDNKEHVGELKEEEKKQEEVEELTEEERQQTEELTEEESRELNGEQVQSHLEVEIENTLHSFPHTQKDIDSPESDSNEKETQDEDGSKSVFSETSTETEKRQTENPQMEEQERGGEKQTQERMEEVKDKMAQEEVEAKQEMENVEDERKGKEEERGLKCSDELCLQSSEDGFARDRDGNDSADRLSSGDEAAMEAEKQNPMADNDQILADRTGVSQTVPAESMERDEAGMREEEEKRDDDEKENDLLYSGESGQNSLPDQLSFGQTAESKKDDQLDSGEADNTDLSDANRLHQGDTTEPEDTGTSSNGIYTERKTEPIHSGHETYSEEDTVREETEINMRHADMQVMSQHHNTIDSEFRTEGGIDLTVSSSDPVISEQTVLSDGRNKETAETGGGGAFGLFKNAFSYFSQTPVAETEGSTEPAPSLDSNTGEASNAQTSLTPQQELDSTTDPSQDYIQESHTESPITVSQQQLQPSPPSTDTQTSSPSQTQTHSHPTESPLQTKPPTKLYKSLLTYISADETTILTELFGRHKLQFLDYILGSSETTTDDPDNDESILLDIERLLHYHRETLVTPSMKLADAPQEDKGKTRALIALQKLEMLLANVRETLSTAEDSCVGGSCSTHSNNKEMATEEDNNVQRDEWMGLDKLSGGTGNEKRGETGKRSEKERVSSESHPHIQPGPPESLEGAMKQIKDFVLLITEDTNTHVHAVRELFIWLTVQVVSSLPDDIRPGPDLYGVPWEPVIISSVVGMVTILLFTCRCYSSVKSRMYRSKERWMAGQVAQLLDEKCKVLETLSKCQQEYDDLESSLRDSGVLAQTQKTEHLEVKARQLGHAKKELERDLKQLKDQLEQQREHRMEQEKRITVLEESMKMFEEEIKDLQSQEEQAQTTLKVYNMNSDRLQRNLETAGEENTLLQESNAQLRQQVEGWAERVSELEAEMSRCEAAHSGMLQDVANKDERIMSLTDRLLRMKGWDSDLEEEEGAEGGEKETSNGTAGRGGENGREDIVDTQGHLQKVQKLIYAAKLNADLKSVDEDKDRIFAKLNDEVKAKEDLQVSIKEMNNEKLSLQSDTEQYADQVQRLQQKLQIMTEMYQENELKLHRLLTVEEKERMQKEEKLNKADKNIALAMEELSNYRQRAEEMEEELEKSKQSYQTQISAHEKKAHNNWLAARAADRDLSDIRRENALLRQKLTDTQFKLDALDKDPYALNSLARPLPFRAERSPYGPSPLGRPASETRAFLSPPTLMDGPPARLSPRVSRCAVEPPGGQGEMERSGGPHSDSGSISPTWERDRRGPPPGPPGPPGPLGPPGYMFPEPGGPMYRRPPPPPGALGLLPPPGSLPPGPLHPRGLPPGPSHPADLADGSYRENSHGPGELEHRESGPGERRTPPEADLRMGGPPPPGPPMGPMDGPFPRRGPPPPDFYPPRGPGGPPMMPMWAPPPMMFPPRFPPGGPPLPPAPHPHYGPPVRPPLPDGHPHPSMGPLPPQQSVPSPPHSQSPEEHTPSPEDAI